MTSDKIKNILLADDDMDDRMFFEVALKQLTIPTYLALANDGLELMSNLESVIEPPPPDVIFLDLNMPRKNGFQCLEEIRNTPKLKDIPVVIFSTTANDDAVNKTYQHGANHYICKPDSIEALVKLIETVLTLEMWQKPQPPKEKFVLSFPDSTENKLANAIRELVFQNEEKEKRAAELIIANKELVFQNEEKEKRAAELIIANKELVFQNEEKEKRAAELIIANKELVFQNEEKEKRAAELIIANKELVFQNEEREKRAAELIIANKELESFTFISSHDLQEPLRKIQIFGSFLIANESQNISDKGKEYLIRIQDAGKRMQSLINDLLAYSRTTTSKREFETTDLKIIIEAVKNDFKEDIAAKRAIIEVGEMCDAYIIPFQFHQLIHNLIGNALKFSNPEIPPYIIVNSRNIKGDKANNQKLLPEKEYCQITIADNGIGFDPKYTEYIFDIFKRLHDQEKISGTGIGLTIAKKIVENHNGIITATGELNKGATFDIYITAI